MATINFPASLKFVWQPGYDNPRDGYHVTPGDSGGGTKAGVIETTWANAVHQGLVTGTLRQATDTQLSLVLRTNFWGWVCDALPNGVDFMLFNGRMMSGRYPLIFQEALGFTDDDLDGDIGPMTVAAAKAMDPRTLVDALHTQHMAYCQSLSSWPLFHNGWTRRLVAVHALAIKMIPVAAALTGEPKS